MNAGWPQYSYRDAWEDGACAYDRGTPIRPNPLEDPDLARGFEDGWKSRQLQVETKRKAGRKA